MSDNNKTVPSKHTGELRIVFAQLIDRLLVLIQSGVCHVAENLISAETTTSKSISRACFFFPPSLG